MRNTVKVNVWVRTNKVGSKCEDVIEFDREDWEDMSEEERENECREIALQMMDWSFEVKN